MKAPVGLLSDRTVLHSKMERPRPDKFAMTRIEFYDNLSQQLNIGKRKVQELRTYDIETFYATLAKTPCGQYVHGVKQKLSEKQKKRLLSSTSIHEVHTLLKTAFSYAVEWDLIRKIPLPRDAPKVNIEERTIWDEKTMLAALQTIENPALHLAVHMSMILSLREGEILGLQPMKEELQAWLEKLKQDEQNAPEKYSNCGQLFRGSTSAPAK